MSSNTFTPAKPDTPSEQQNPTASMHSCRTASLANVFSCSSIDQQQRRHSSHQRPNGKIFGARRWQYRLEYFPWRVKAYPMAQRSSPKSVAPKRNCQTRKYSGRHNGGKQIVNVTIQSIIEPKPLHGMVMIVFTM